MCNTLGHSEELCVTRQLKWSNIDTTDPRDRLIFDLILSYPKQKRFQLPFDIHLANRLMFEAYPEAEKRQKTGL